MNAPTALPRTFGTRLRWAMLDSWTITLRDLSHWVRSPERVLWELGFTIVSVLLFGYVFGSSIFVPGGGDYREFLMPGIFGMTMLFGVGGTMIEVCTDAHRGVTDRFRSMPMSPEAVVGGRSLADMINAVISLVILVGTGMVIGWRWRGSLADALAAFGLLLLFRFALIWVGIYLGLIVKNPETANAMFALLFPLSMIANTFVAPEMMPGWLGTLAEWNPLSATVGATRELFGNPVGLNAGSWVAEHAILMAVVWPVALLLIFVPLAIRRYRNLSR
jgi:ABC-type multidrug transport system permease subunit